MSVPDSFPPPLLARKWNIKRKEDKAMTYTKPEVRVLGEATRLIEITGKGNLVKDNESPRTHTAPAYDLDE